MLLCERLFDALVGEIVGKRFMTGWNLLATIHVEEFHFGQQGTAAFADSVEYLRSGDLFRDNEGKVLNYRRIVADRSYRLQLPTGFDERFNVHLSCVETHPAGDLEVEQHLRVNFSHNA